MAPSGTEQIRIDKTGQVDCSSLLPLEVSGLPRGLHPTCIAFHPEKPLLAVGVSNCVGAYDLITGCRTGRVEVGQPAVDMAFSPDGSMLVVATRAWHLVGINTTTWRSRLLAPNHAGKTTPLEGILIAITARNAVFFTRIGKLTIRMAVTAEQLGRSESAKKSGDKLKWGLKLKLADVKKPIIAMAAHPTGQQLMVLLEDGNVRGYTLGSTGVVPVFPPTFMLPMDTFVGRGPNSMLMQAVAHPTIPGACLLLLGSAGGGLGVLELQGRDEPALLLSGRTPDGASVIGLGLHKDTRTLLGFVATEVGGVRAVGWQLVPTRRAVNTPGLTAASLTAVPVPVRMSSLEGTQAVDVLTAHQQQQQRAATASAPMAGGGGNSSSGAAGGASAGKMGWQGLWGSNATPAANFGSNYLLCKLLAPIVNQVLLHPALGLLATRRVPPLALQQAPGIKDQAIGGITGEEAAIARRTASIGILRVTSDAHPLSAWPGALATPLHTALDFWQSSTGLSPLAFPCHLYYLGGGRISKYGLATKQSGTLATLAPASPSSQMVRTERFMVYSARQQAWLVFVETAAAVNPAKAAGMAPGSPAPGAPSAEAPASAAAGGAAAGPTGSEAAPTPGPVSMGGDGTSFNAAIAAFLAASNAGQAPTGSSSAAGQQRGPGSPSASAAAAAGSSGERGRRASWEFTLVKAGQPNKEMWFLPGKAGAFLGPDDSLFAILPEAGHRISVYSTTGCKGHGPPAFTIDLGKPATQLGGLFAGPPALGAPYVGAEAAAEAKRKEEAAAAKAEAEAAAKAAAEGEQEEGKEAEEEVKEVDPFATTSNAAGLLPGGRLPRWMRGEQDDSSDDGDDFIPVVGIGPAFKGGNRGRPAGADAYSAAMARAVAGFITPAAADAEAAAAAAAGPTHHSGGGVLMWHSAGGKLVMAGLPAPGVQYAAGDDSDDPDAAEELAGAPKHEGTVVGEYSLQLLPEERVLHVAWQNLGTGPPLEPHRCAGAILTSHRLLLVTGDLGVVASVDARKGSTGAVHPITSLLWVGPALLYMTAGGQVMQLTWTGDTAQVASVANTPTPLLLGALPDSLLLLRLDPSTGNHQVTSRAVSILQPLVLGWCSLAAAGLVPKGLIRSRAALQNILQAFDATHVTSGLLWALIGAWCWDVAAALSSHCVNVDPAVALAANAAAGQWQPVVTALLGEHQRSVYHPRPAPPGTALHHKLLAGAAGAICHGQFGSAAPLLRAAGEWETALALAVCQGDFATLREMSLGGLMASSSGEASEVAALAAALVAANDRNTRMYGTGGALGGLSSSGSMGGPLALGLPLGLAPADWRLRCSMADNSFFSDARNWSFGASGALPAAATSGFNAPAGSIQDGEVGPIPHSEISTLAVYLGLSDLADSSSRGRPSVDGQGRRGAGGLEGVSAGPTGGSVGSADGGFGGMDLDMLLSGLVSAPSLVESTTSSMKRSDSMASAVSSDTEGGSKAAAAGGDKDPFAGLGFDSDGDEEGGGYTQRKFKIVIKPKESQEGQSSEAGGAAAGPTGGDLKEAGSRLKLGLPGPGAGPTGGSFSQRLKGSQSPSHSGGGGGGGAQSLPSPGRPGLPPKGKAGGPQLGGPPMRPKSAAGGAPAAPAFTDEDFFAALAPVIPAGKQEAVRAAPPPPPSAGAAATRRSSGTAATAAAGRAAAEVVPPAPVAARPAPAPPPGAAAAAGGPTGGNPTQLYLQGVAAMETAQWDAAAAAFGATLDALASEPPSDGRTQRQQFAAQYLAVVLLLKAAASGTGAKEARLYRYAAALKLDDRHAMLVTREAIVRNKQRGNYRYCGDLLTSLVTTSLGKAPMEVMAQMQEDIDACDRAGGRDGELPRDEDRESFVSLVAAGCSRQDVEEVVLPLLGQ